MSEDQYWRGKPRLVEAYRKLAINKRKEKNEYLWLQGMYIYEAFSVVLHNAFRKNGTRPIHYASEPYRVTAMTKAEKKEKAEAERKKAIASLTAWKAAWDQKNV